MLIKDLLKQKGTEIITISRDSSTLDALEIFNSRHIGSLIVKGTDGSVAGILSERDILRHFQESVRGVPVSQIMTARDKLIISRESDNIEYAMSVMTEHRIRHLPVFEGDRLVGLVSIGDVMKAVSAQQKFATRLLEDYISGSQGFVS
jgi:CBS domain-containing protein